MAERIRLFAEHHIVAVRTQRRTGEIVAVKHAAWGWISPQQYYMMQEAHTAAVGMLPKMIEGGYRLKEAIWNASFEVEVLASGVKLPLGLAFFAGASALATVDALEGRQDKAFLDLISLVLPFGELWLLYRGVAAVGDINAATNATIQQFDITPPPGKSHYVGYWPFGHWE